MTNRKTAKKTASSATAGNKSTRIGAFLVSPYPARDGWRVRIDAKVHGSEKSKFFSAEEGEAAAILWAAERNNEFVAGNVTPLDGSANRCPDSSGTLKVAVMAYLAAKVGEVTPDQLRLVKNHLTKLVNKFGGLPTDGVDPLICRTWIRSLNLAQRTRWGVYSSGRTFYKWALRYGYATTSPFERMEPIPKGEAPKAILTPEQMTAALHLCSGFTRDFLVLGGFCGLRPIEVFRSDWSAMNFKTKEFHVRPDVIKRDNFRGRGIKERFVHVPPVALALLSRGKEGKIIPMSQRNFQPRIGNIAKALGLMNGEKIGWPHDCLRHSAATYRLAELEDAAKVANWLGHTTTAQVHESYAKAIPKGESVKWWAIQLDSLAIAA